MWNLASQAATLPGIELEKTMHTFERNTAWDVLNYRFTDPNVAILYKILKEILTKYQIAQYEDYLIRKLREGLKLKKFYMNDKAFEHLERSLETDIIEVQTITRNFIQKLIHTDRAHNTHKLTIQVSHHSSS